MKLGYIFWNKTGLKRRTILKKYSGIFTEYWLFYLRINGWPQFFLAINYLFKFIQVFKLFKDMEDTFEQNAIFHIYGRAIGNEKLFKEEKNFKFFLEKYAHYMEGNVKTLAYCLIPNHFHFLVKIKAKPELALKRFSDFLNSYSKSFNKAYLRRGSLFQRKFKRKKVSDENYFSRIVIYIHANPIKHLLVKSPADWKYSSFNSFLTDKDSKIDRDTVIGWFGDLHGFKEAHNANLDSYLSDDLALE